MIQLSVTILANCLDWGLQQYHKLSARSRASVIPLDISQNAKKVRDSATPNGEHHVKYMHATGNLLTVVIIKYLGNYVLCLSRNLPCWTKKVDRFREEVIVDETGVDGEKSHEKDYVPPSKYHVPNLTK